MKKPPRSLRQLLLLSLILSIVGFYYQWNYYRIGLNWSPRFGVLILWLMFGLLLSVGLTLWVFTSVFLERKQKPVWLIPVKLLGGLWLPVVFIFSATAGNISTERYLRGLHDRLDLTCSESKLRAWAEEIRNTYPGGSRGNRPGLDSLPACFADLPQPGNHPYLILEPEGPLIPGWPDFGSDMYGILFSDRTAKVQPDETLRRLEWKPGIDVFIQPEG